jgi:formylglycine-generating enzyme required for sulfatase activity
MAGNIWEWNYSFYAGYPYPELWTKRQQWEDMKALGLWVLRGGAFLDNQSGVRCAFRHYLVADTRYYQGFRIVVSPFL